MAGNLSGQRTGQSVANAERFHEIARRIRESSSKYVAVAILQTFVHEVLTDFVCAAQELGERAAETARIADANLVGSLPFNLIWESNQGRDEYHCARCGDSYTPCKHWAASQFMPVAQADGDGGEFGLREPQTKGDDRVQPYANHHLWSREK